MKPYDESQHPHLPVKSPSAWARRITQAVGITVLIGHFSFTSLSQATASLPEVHAKRLLAHYVHPFFTQHWRLFAPSPPLSDMRVEIRCRDQAGTESPWLDPRQPKGFAGLSPARNFNRLNNVAVRTMGLYGEQVANLIRSTVDATPERVEFVRKAVAADINMRVRRQETAYRIARSYCEQRSPDIEAVMLRLFSSEIPKYSKRNEPRPLVRLVLETPWRRLSEPALESLPEEALPAAIDAIFAQVLETHPASMNAP